MAEELCTASNLLNAAIERYTAACAAFTIRRDLNEASQGTLDVIIDELGLAKSHKLRIMRAEMSLAQARNGIHSLVPIHRLSFELLTVIFGLVVAVDRPSPYSAKPKTDARNAFSVSQPEAITHVCSRWRRIGLDLHWLWSRVAVPFRNSRVDCGLLLRAKIFAERARQLPLDVHFFDSINHTVPHINSNLAQFCTTSATRIRSLCLSPSKRFGSHHIEALQSILINSVPGTLVELAVRGNTTPKSGSSNSVTDVTNAKLPEDIEDRLGPIKTLRLTGIFFHWNSQAYQGLTELRLLPVHQDPIVSLTELQLRNILAASPKLLVFHFGLEIAESTSDFSSYATVNLKELEELNLGKIGLNGYCVLFRSLSLGSRPLDMSLAIPRQGISALKEGFELFLAHSKVRRLYLRFMTDPLCDNEIQLAHLFGQLPHLEALVLNGADIGLHACDLPKQPHTLLPTGPQLNTLVLVNCRMDLGYLRKITGIVPIQSIQLAYCSARSNSTSESGHFFKAAGFYREMGNIFPVHRFFTLPGATRHYSEKAADLWSPWL